LIDIESNGKEFYGTAFICVQRSNKNIEIITELSYHTSQAKTYTIASNTTRELYFYKLQSLEGMYNLNDKRFWKSEIWKNHGN